eukprot:8385416-Alexandrium_andersonii.AAC.1
MVGQPLKYNRACMVGAAPETSCERHPHTPGHAPKRRASSTLRPSAGARFALQGLLNRAAEH